MKMFSIVELDFQKFLEYLNKSRVILAGILRIYTKQNYRRDSRYIRENFFENFR